MARGEFDILDMIAFPVFSFAALSDNGIMPPVDLLGWSPTDILWSAGAHTEITWATIISLVALAVVIGTNKPELDIWGGLQAWVVIATALLVVAPPFVPLLSSFIVGNQIVGFLAFTVQSSGYLAVSWMG